MKRLVNKLIRNKDNQIVVWQSPNLVLSGWFAFLVLAYFATAGILKIGLMDLSTACLFAWSYLEITQGASYFRRLLGTIVILNIVISYFR